MKQKALKIINPILMISLFIQIIAVGLLVGEVAEEQIGQVVFLTHKFNGMALVLIGLVHLILNWNWVKSMFKGAKP